MSENKKERNVPSKLKDYNNNIKDKSDKDLKPLSWNIFKYHKYSQKIARASPPQVKYYN